MKLYKIIGLGLILSIAAGLSACIDTDENEDLGPCGEIRASRYKDLKTTQFTVNESETYYQNYTPYTYRDDPTKASEFSKLWITGGAEGLINLHFTRIEFDNDCVPYRKHGFTIYLEIDQLPTESKTYNVGPVSSPSFAFYTFGKALEEGELIRNSIADAGTITIDKWISGRILNGSFDININGILVEGSFEYDLTSDYSDF